jgi:hypothetical protein
METTLVPVTSSDTALEKTTLTKNCLTCWARYPLRRYLIQVFFMYFTYDRHESAATPTYAYTTTIEDWRPRERLSTPAL